MDRTGEEDWIVSSVMGRAWAFRAGEMLTRVCGGRGPRTLMSIVVPAGQLTDFGDGAFFQVEQQRKTHWSSGERRASSSSSSSCAAFAAFAHRQAGAIRRMALIQARSSPRRPRRRSSRPDAVRAAAAGRGAHPGRSSPPAREPVREGRGAAVLVEAGKHFQENVLCEVFLARAARQVSTHDLDDQGIELLDQGTRGLLVPRSHGLQTSSHVERCGTITTSLGRLGVHVLCLGRKPGRGNDLSGGTVEFESLRPSSINACGQRFWHQWRCRRERCNHGVGTAEACAAAESGRGHLEAGDGRERRRLRRICDHFEKADRSDVPDFRVGQHRFKKVWPEHGAVQRCAA